MALHAALLFGGAPLWQTLQQIPAESPPLVARLVEPDPPPPFPSPPQPPAQEKKSPPVSKPATTKPKPRPAPEPVSQQPPAAGELAAPSQEIAKLEPAPGTAAPAPAVAAPADSTPLLISQYGIELKGETQRQAKYPPAARREGWEGKGELLLVVGEDGRIAELTIVRSSGYVLLDRALIDAVRRAQPRVEIPGGLRGRRFEVALPFVMNLVNE